MKKYVIKNEDGTTQTVMPAIHNTRKEALLTILHYATEVVKRDKDDSRIEIPVDYMVEEVYMKDVNEEITDYESALESIGPTGFWHVRTVEQNVKALIALNKLFTIAAAWNKLDEFVPDFSNKEQTRWIPMFSYCSAASKFACTFTTKMPDTLNKNVCTRLCFKTQERAWQFGTQFLDLYNQVFLL